MNPSAIRRALLLTSLITALLTSGAVRVLTAPSHARLLWIVASSGLKRLEATPHPAGLLHQAFDHAGTWVIVGPRLPAWLASWRCRRVFSFRSYTAMQKRLGHPTGIWGVLFDPENWPFTPPIERQDVPGYTARVARLVHARGLRLIVTPGTDLAHSLLPRPGNQFRAFVRLGLARRIAAAADVYEIQSQGAENHPRLFAWYIAQEAAQVRAGNPHATVLAGLSTNPHGLRVTGAEVFREVQATRHLVQGYWLNVPQGGPGCPTCGRDQPQVAIQLLESLRAKELL